MCFGSGISELSGGELVERAPYVYVAFYKLQAEPKLSWFTFLGVEPGQPG